MPAQSRLFLQGFYKQSDRTYCKKNKIYKTQALIFQMPHERLRWEVLLEASKADTVEENSRLLQVMGTKPMRKQEDKPCRQGEVCIKTSGARLNMTGLGQLWLACSSLTSEECWHAWLVAGRMNRCWRALNANRIHLVLLRSKGLQWPYLPGQNPVCFSCRYTCTCQIKWLSFGAEKSSLWWWGTSEGFWGWCNVGFWSFFFF